MSEQSVWVFQSSRLLENSEKVEIEQKMSGFLSQWKAHGSALSAKGKVYENLFLIITLDQATKASGCSIDACIKFIMDLESGYDFTFFDRNRIAYKKDGKVTDCTIAEFKEHYAAGRISNDQLMINTLVTNNRELKENWEVSLQNSWHKRLL